jgi:hypothetical protein
MVGKWSLPLSYIPRSWFIETGIQYVTQAGLKLAILLPLPLECWNCRCVLPRPAASSLLHSILCGIIPTHAQ